MTMHVDSGGSNTSPYDTWAKAATSFANVTGAAAGEIVKVHKTFSQDPGASVTYNFSNGTDLSPVQVLCVDKDASDALSTGAAIAQTVSARNIILQGAVRIRGMTFNSADTMSLAVASKKFLCELCTFGIVVTGSSRTINLAAAATTCAEYIGCTFNTTVNANHSVSLPDRGRVKIAGCTFNPHASGTILNAGSAGCNAEISCSTFGSANTLINIGGASNSLKFEKCSLGTYTSITSSTVGFETDCVFNQCASGTVSGPTTGLFRKATHRGLVESSTAEYRSGGASRNGTGFSWKMTPNANAEEQVCSFTTPDFCKEVDGGSPITITVYIAGSVELYDDEVWLEIEGPDDSNTTQGYYHSTVLPYLATRAVLASDASSWIGGSPVGTVRKLTHTYTPNHSGLLVCRVHYAKTSGAAIYVNPKIGTTSEDFFIGKSMFGVESSGGLLRVNMNGGISG